jgi:dTDP-4-amino-4,6-dideoxygalactose transaminase
MKIPHSRPFLPPLNSYQRKVEEIWSNGWLTNHGPMLQQFEAEIAAYLDLPYVSYVSSGTTGLQCALRVLPRGGEIITTPFSYVATAGAIFWEGFKPVFADIHRQNLALDPANLEALITPQTRAILATHVYGIPAQVDALQAIAEKHGLELMYDAAHCFGVRLNDKSLLSHGRFSVLSLHATKVFHTANGGLVASQNAEDKAMIDSFRNFGHEGPNHFVGPGINGKNSELHAALGLAILPHAETLLQKRVKQWHFYRNLLNTLPAHHFLQVPEGCTHNGAYFPILDLEPAIAKRVIDALKLEGIEARRYFQPALNKVEYLQGASCPVAEGIAASVFCLPLHHHLSDADQQHIAALVLNHL